MVSECRASSPTLRPFLLLASFLRILWRQRCLGDGDPGGVFRDGRAARVLEFSDLLLKVVVERAFDDARILFLQLSSIEIDEQRLHIVQELVDPREMDEGLVDCLALASQQLIRTRPTTQTHHEYQTQIPRRRPFQGVLVLSERRLAGRHAVFGLCRCPAMLLDKDVFNQTVDDVGPNARVASRP